MSSIAENEGFSADELSIARALGWFFDICPNRENLENRIGAARRHFIAATETFDGRWATANPIEDYPDKPAMYLSQAQGLLRDRRSYDLEIGARVMPFLAMIGNHVDTLAAIPGAAERSRRFLNKNSDHPDSGLFELVAALRYAREPGCFVEFIEENPKLRMADFMVHDGDRENGIHVECKRLRSSGYEQRELVAVGAMLSRINDFVHASKASFSIDATFSSEVADIPQSYLLEKLSTVAQSRIALRGAYPWRDEFGHGEIRFSDLAAVHGDTEDDYLLFGPKMARLLAGRDAVGEPFHMVGGGSARLQDPRYVDQLHYGTVVFWRCAAPASIDARSRFVKSKLADIDRQLAKAPTAIAHIGMDAERDIAAADMRRQKNLAAVSEFRFEAPVLDIELHYFLPRVTESSSWMIDETADSFTGALGSFLPDPRLLSGGFEGIDRSLPAWRQPVPR